MIVVGCYIFESLICENDSVNKNICVHESVLDSLYLISNIEIR